jgi:hypothetical protein
MESSRDGLRCPPFGKRCWRKAGPSGAPTPNRNRNESRHAPAIQQEVFNVAPAASQDPLRGDTVANRSGRARAVCAIPRDSFERTGKLQPKFLG